MQQRSGLAPQNEADSGSSARGSSRVTSGWFGELTSKRIRRGTFRNVPELITAIEDFMVAWNLHPKPFVWTATVDSIVKKLQRCRQTLENIQPGCTLPRSGKRRKK